MTPVVLASGWSICDVADSGFCSKLFSANKNEIEFWGSSIIVGLHHLEGGIHPNHKLRLFYILEMPFLTK